MDQFWALMSVLSWGNRLALPVALLLLIWSYRQTGSRATLLLAIGLGLWALNWAVGLGFSVTSPLLFPGQVGVPAGVLPAPLAAWVPVMGQLLRVAGAVVVAVGALRAVEEWTRARPDDRERAGS